MSAQTTRRANPRPASARAALSARARFAALFAALLVMLVGFGPAAQAHDAIVSSDPRDSQNIAPGHRDFVLTFSDKIQTFGAELVLEDASGKRVNLTPIIRDDQLRGAATADLPAGPGTLRWRAVSSDGHPIDGIITFTVVDPSKSQSAVPTASSTAPSPSATPTATSGSGGRINTPLLLLGILAALCGIVGSIAGMRMRKKE